MPRSRSKGNLTGTVTKVGALAVGGFVADKVTGLVEQQLVKSKPEWVRLAPLFTTIGGILGATYMKDGFVKTGFEGMATIGLLENLQNAESKISNSTSSTTDTTSGDSSGTTNMEGIMGPARMNAGAPFRMQGTTGLRFVS